MFQRIQVIGNLGHDPEMKMLPDGETAVTKFSVATTKKWKTKDGQQHSQAIWFNVSVFGAQAESCNEYLTKGSGVFVEGELTADENGGPRIWTGKDGKPRASFEVRAMTVRFVGQKGDKGEAKAAPTASADEEWEDAA